MMTIATTPSEKCLDPPGFGQAVIDGVAVDHAAYF